MAGLGYKLFASGEVLTAANLQGYAVDQSVMKFATTAARTSALAAPSQGMLSWIDATGTLEQYYELYNASTNVGGAKTAGWYPTANTAIFHGTCSRTAATGTNYNAGATGFLFTELVDSVGWHSTVSNTDRITPTYEGIYRITASAQFGASGTGNRFLSANKNAGDGVSAYVAGSLARNLCVTYVMYMNGTTDYFLASMTQDSGGNLSLAAQVTVEYLRPSSA